MSLRTYHCNHLPATIGVPDVVWTTVRNGCIAGISVHGSWLCIETDIHPRCLSVTKLLTAESFSYNEAIDTD